MPSLKKNTSILLIAILSLGIFFSILAKPTYAASDDGTFRELLRIYCERRKGNQLNLETWYGGRCNTDNLGDTIGFGDIILLDLASKLTGEDPTESSYQKIFDLFGKTSQKPLLEKIATINSIPNNGAIGDVAKGLGSLYATPPASSLDYLASIRSNLAEKKLIQPALAQSTTGYGFQALSALLPIWKAFRDVTYLIFILGFIGYGLMIMFRMKINPQTVISVQLAIPKLIITLLLISFSYAIAGFMIDLFYLLWTFLLNVLNQGGLIYDPSSSAVGSASGYKYGLIGPLFWLEVHISNLSLMGKIWSGITGMPLALSKILTYAFAGLNVIFGLIILLAVLYTLAKTYWMLLKSYVYLVLQILFSPLILLGNLIPGSSSFINWIKNMFAELSVFASVMFMFLLAFYFIGPVFDTPFGSWGGVGPRNNSKKLWIPPPLTGNGSTSGVEGKFAILGLGLFLMTPKIAEMVKNSLKIRDYGYGSTLGEALKFGINPFNIPGFFVGSVKKEISGIAGGMFSGSLTEKVVPGITGTESERQAATGRSTPEPPNSSDA